MNSLPIVTRELRVAARKPSTFWLRLAAAFIALVIGVGFMILNQIQGTAAAQLGRVLFFVLTWIAFAAAITAGLFLTSDSLSEEKREGTLGLLFLTPLRGYDVVFGKLAATSLRGLFAFFAILPILAITQLMGGVSAGEYWKASLALVNALLFSLATGMFASVLSRDSQKAMAGTLLLLLLVTLGGPGADALVAGIRNRSPQPVASLLSPAFVLGAAGSRSVFWQGVLANQILTWAFLAVTCLAAPRSWQDKKRAAESSRPWVYAWKYGGTRRRLRLRRKLLEVHPVAWLTCRERWQSVAVWTVAVVSIAIFVLLLFIEDGREIWILGNYVSGVFLLALYLWAASQACRFLSDARRTGILELLLISPLNEKEIVRGQWRALLRLFALPVMLLLGVQAGGAALSQVAFHQLAKQTSAAISTATNQVALSTNQGVYSGSVTVSISGRSNAVTVGSGTQGVAVIRPNAAGPLAWQQIVLAAAAAIVAVSGTIANLLALCWFGMWMAVTSRTSTIATLKTIVFVQVAPWFVISFGASMLAGLFMFRFMAMGPQGPAWLMWWPLLSAGISVGLAIAKDIWFIWWSRRKLYGALRLEATRRPGEPRFYMPSSLPPVAPPPVIPASSSL